ncbi:inorganic phosphate transporter [Falsirhodobacter xinxiangensis]|uniref:inorganic phosphate transporter n=1 Tax=Falsirhodobacter xinxiangensis TaxID=2530049 RepID=UPI0010A9F972|nr:inorganic phosphate transporter [Rhodobacter xinxiangensis]
MTEPNDRRRQEPAWDILDRDLGRISSVEYATSHLSQPLVAVGMAMVFVALAAIWAAVATDGSGSLIVIVASGLAAYLAMNIGANDVSNNMGPAVGANALTMTGALVLAAICEAAGALIAGGDVVDTIATGIVDPGSLADGRSFVIAMMAALLSSALWLNFATWIGAPVSTTHTIVGGVAGAGIAAAGLGAVNWAGLSLIAFSWIVSPVVGGTLAASVLWVVHRLVIDRDDKIAAARIWVPVMIAVMCWAFTTYLADKILKHLFDVSTGNAMLIGVVCALLSWAAARTFVARRSVGLRDRNRSLKVLFQLPLVLSAALMSFAHGANDVSNAVGPLAAIVSMSGTESGTIAAAMPLWVMVIGALGISVGLLLFGPRLIRTVGSQITKLNAMRAYCVVLATAVTVIVASGLGLPVSTTHIAIGGVFGVGFFREAVEARRMRHGAAQPILMAAEERARRKLVRRSHFMTIVAAWIITVPMTATASAILFLVLNAVGALPATG